MYYCIILFYRSWVSQPDVTNLVTIIFDDQDVIEC